MPTVLISDKMSPLAAKVFAERGIKADVKTSLSPEELKACIGKYDGLAVRSSTKVTAEIINAASNLKVIGRAGIGIDNVDVPAATSKGVVVMNTPFGNSITTAEHAIALILSLTRQIPQANASTHEGKWEKNKFMGVEIMGKTLGVIGCGNIGSIVADRALGLKMKVIAYDPYLSPERAADVGVEKVELDDLIRRSDFISLHTPLTEATRSILDAKAMSKMKKGVRIINCARGGLIVEEDLKEALESGQVAAAALDVFSEEPATKNVLFGMENVVATPHLGASTTEAQEKVAIQVAEQMADYLTAGAVVNALNMPSLSAEDAPRLKPYMKLADQLGSFCGQIAESGLKSAAIEYEGTVSGLNVKPLTAMILKGLLSPLLESVNMVSAPVIAKERDIDIAETVHARATAYQSLIKLTVESENQTCSVAGTLFASDRPRLVEIMGIPIDAELGAHMLYVANEDKPGMIGALGTALGDAGVNIATFHLGRRKEGGDAIALIEVDQAVDNALLNKVRAMPRVKKVKALMF